jgi:hypothetical protein
MELDELRADWGKLAAPEKAFLVPDIRKAGRDLHSPVRHMLRNLRFEAILLFVTYLFVIGFYFIAFRGWMKEISWFTLSIGLVFAIYYYKKRLLLKSLERMDGSLQANLGNKLDTLGRYVHFYIWAGTLLGPLTLAFIGWLARKKIPAFSPYNVFFPSAQNPLWKAALAWLIAMLAITAILYVLNKWYVDKLYGKYLRRLRSLHREMNEDETTNLHP